MSFDSALPFGKSNGIGASVRIPVVTMPSRLEPRKHEELYEAATAGSLTAKSADVAESDTDAPAPDPVISESVFQILFDKNPVPMWVTSEETKRFLYVNESAIRRYGHSAYQFGTKTIYDLCAPEERGRLSRWFESRNNHVGGSTGYWRHQTADGDLIWVEMFRERIEFHGQAASLTTATDVTEQVRGWEERLAFQEALLASEESARRNAESLLRILEEMADGFFTVDSDWRITFVNHQAAKLFGQTRDDLAGKSLWEIFPGWVGSTYEAKYREAVQSGNSVSFEERMFEDAHWFEVQAYPVAGVVSPSAAESAGATLSVTMRDVHVRKTMAAEQERRQQERLQATRQQRRLLKEMLGAVTQGKLHFCEDGEDLPGALTPWCPPIPLKTSAALATLRQKVRDAAQACGFSPDRCHGLVSGSGECAINALLYGDAQGNTQGRIVVSPDLSRIQVWVEDYGQGIPLDLLPKETLSRGQGFSIMLDAVDIVHLLTGSQGTTVVLEMFRNPPETEADWLAALPKI